jgi:hypothetical protein
MKVCFKKLQNNHISHTVSAGGPVCTVPTERHLLVGYINYGPPHLR